VLFPPARVTCERSIISDVSRVGKEATRQKPAWFGEKSQFLPEIPV
jgi:hypothetical protein